MSILQVRNTNNRRSKSTTSTFEPVPYRAEPCTQCDSVKTCLNNEFRNFDRSILKRVSTVVYDSPPPLHVINAEKRILRQEESDQHGRKGNPSRKVASMTSQRAGQNQRCVPRDLYQSRMRNHDEMR